VFDIESVERNNEPFLFQVSQWPKKPEERESFADCMLLRVEWLRFLRSSILMLLSLLCLLFDCYQGRKPAAKTGQTGLDRASALAQSFVEERSATGGASVDVRTRRPQRKQRASRKVSLSV
jgi:hypothetical protein